MEYSRFKNGKGKTWEKWERADIESQGCQSLAPRVPFLAEHTPAMSAPSQPSIASLNLRNKAPCKGLVKKSAIIASVGT